MFTDFTKLVASLSSHRIYLDKGPCSSKRPAWRVNNFLYRPGRMATLYMYMYISETVRQKVVVEYPPSSSWGTIQGTLQGPTPPATSIKGPSTPKALLYGTLGALQAKKEGHCFPATPFALQGAARNFVATQQSMSPVKQAITAPSPNQPANTQRVAWDASRLLWVRDGFGVNQIAVQSDYCAV